MSLAQEEMRDALAVLKSWPKDAQAEILLLTPNEREMMMLAAAYLNARPT